MIESRAAVRRDNDEIDPLLPRILYDFLMRLANPNFTNYFCLVGQPSCDKFLQPFFILTSLDVGNPIRAIVAGSERSAPPMAAMSCPSRREGREDGRCT